MAPDIKLITGFRTAGEHIANHASQVIAKDIPTFHAFALFSGLNNYLRGQLDAHMCRRHGVSFDQPEVHRFEAVEQLLSAGYDLKIAGARPVPSPSRVLVVADYMATLRSAKSKTEPLALARFKIEESGADGNYILSGNPGGAFENFKPLLVVPKREDQPLRMHFEGFATEMLKHMEKRIEVFLGERPALAPAVVELKRAALG